MSAKKLTVQIQRGNTNAGGDVNTEAVPLPAEAIPPRQRYLSLCRHTHAATIYAAAKKQGAALFFGITSPTA